MAKTNKFRTKKIKKENILLIEDRKSRSAYQLFLKENGKLIFIISLLFSFTIFLISAYMSISNMGKTSFVKYESNGVVVNFKSPDESILNGTPITIEYANKLFDSNLYDNKNQGVIIKIKELKLDFGTIIFYSDKTVLIKYNDGTYRRVSSINNDYAIDDNGVINSKAESKILSGYVKQNNSGIEMLYLSDDSIEVTYNNTSIFIRNNDITSTDKQFYTNLSLVSIMLKKDNNKSYYSNGIIKENNMLIVDDKNYNFISEKKIFDNIIIKYYENNYAEVIKDDLNIIVGNGLHINYDNNIFEIVYKKDNLNTKDLLDIKEIVLDNTNDSDANYLIVLEETNNYDKYDVKRLDNKYINYKIYDGGKTTENKILSNNLKDNKNYNFKNNTYLLYDSKIPKLSKKNINIGMWISYENITNEYMNSAFIGTVKVYIEAIN